MIIPRSCFILLATLWVAVASVASLPLRGAVQGREENTSILNLDLVVKSIADYISANPSNQFQQQSSFVVAGSYPAAVKAHEKNPQAPILPYNDIDVFVEASTRNCRGEISKAYYREGIIPDSNMTVNFVHVCRPLDMKALIDGFDINAIMVGVQVDINGRVEARTNNRVLTVQWHSDPAFDEFLLSRRLELVRKGSGQYAGSLIRLLYKAQQSGLAYKVWDGKRLDETMHGSTLNAAQKGKLDQLRDPYRNVIANSFDVWEIQHSPCTYMLVLKGKLPPKPDPQAIARDLRNRY